ncbi:MAG TPA: FtsX-like permease family protein [Candidatus Limnocylindrales bacterium]
MGLNRLAWRMLAARPLRTLLTIAGIGLGVGVLAASLTLGAALDASIDRTVRDIVGHADLRISAFLEDGLSTAAIKTITSTPGVATTAAAVEHRTFLDAQTGDPQSAVTVLGVNPATYPQVHDLTLVAGSGFTDSSEPIALVTQSLAEHDHYTIGSPITLLGVGGEQQLRVVGILAGSGGVAGSGRTVLVPISIARTVFQLTGATRVDVQLDPGADPATVAKALADRMTEPYVLSSPADIAAGLRASASAFQGTAALIAAIVLFVGTFLIVNTLSMTVGERAREVGLLRMAGSTRGQVVRFIFSGAIVLGVVGSALGVTIGSAFAYLLATTVSAATGVSAIVTGIDGPSAITSGLVGLGITILAAIEPALRAARISPFEAMRARFDLPSARAGRLGWIALVFVLVAALALVAWPPAIAGAGAQRALLVYGVLLVATLLTPFFMRPMARLLGAPVSLVLRLEERLARGSLARDRSRTALTLGSLVVGLAMVVALGWSAQAARASANAWLQGVIPGDEVVSSIRPIGPDEGIREALQQQPGVARVTPIGTFDVAYRGYRLDAAAVVGADLLADGRLTAVSGDRTAALSSLDAGGSVILPEATATRLGVHVGDTMSLLLAQGGHLDLRVSAIVERSIPATSGEAILVSWKDATDSLGVAGADAFAVRFTPGASQADRDNLSATATQYALEASPIAKIQGAVADALSRVFGLFDVLAIIAVIVAALGIVNTLTMSVLERVRELGVLRAIGMSRRQAFRMVVVEAWVLGIVGVVLGAVVGVGVGVVMLAMGGTLAPIAGVPWVPIEIAAILGLALPIVAAIYPSRMAAKVSIVQALQFE